MRMRRSKECGPADLKAAKWAEDWTQNSNWLRFELRFCLDRSARCYSKNGKDRIQCRGGVFVGTKAWGELGREGDGVDFAPHSTNQFGCVDHAAVCVKMNSQLHTGKGR